jgi:two-component system cell cycle response regulator DivK
MNAYHALIIEDDMQLGPLFRTILEQLQVSSEIISNGRTAEARLADPEAAIPHLIVLDIQLPGISGVDLLRQIRSAPHLKGVKVVVISATLFVARDAELDADLMLAKPVSVDQMLDLVGRLLPR